ncbi:uncharacterized protein [Centruroides vittatus]|uniref:uncharacterized protein n=1 Tax=Centruroides vittatus TaxID=120091 RepID=UPI003510AA9D
MISTDSSFIFSNNEIIIDWNDLHELMNKNLLLEDEKSQVPDFIYSCGKKLGNKRKNFRFPEVNIEINEKDEKSLFMKNEIYIKNILPDPQFYIFKPNQLAQQTYQSVDDGKKYNGKKNRLRYNATCYVCRLNQENQTINCLLPEGTKLIKPKKKLVALVADVLYNSPEGILPVQQIYSALQKRYPYFLFMNKNAVNSWKSSVRHAIFQKWFFKMKICNGNYKQKCSYWALNTACTPKEWIMPGINLRERGVLAQSDILTAVILINYLQQSNCISQNKTINEDKLTDININLDQSNQSSKILAMQNKYPNISPKQNLHMHNEKEYDPVISGIGYHRIKKCLHFSNEDEKENYPAYLNIDPQMIVEKNDDKLFHHNNFKVEEENNQYYTLTSLMQNNPHNNENCNYLEIYELFDFCMQTYEDNPSSSNY